MALLNPRKRKASGGELTQPPVMPTVSDRLIRLPDVMQITGLKRATIYKHAALGTFPAVVKLTAKASGWRATELNRWLAGERNFKVGGAS